MRGISVSFIGSDMALSTCKVLCGVLLVIGICSSALAADDAGLPTNSPPQGILTQLPPGVTPAQALQQLQRQNPTSPNSTSQPAVPQQQQLYVNASRAITETTSPLETLYSDRAKSSLKQFGYDLVGNGGTPWILNNNGIQVPIGNGGSVAAPQIGAVQDDYILGPGDQINVTFRGDQNTSFDIFVARDGTVTLPAMSPIPAAGRSFGDFRADVERAAAATYLKTRVFVTVTQVRQISVRVVGEVANPGTYALTGLSTVLDALNLAGGIKKSGSLRNITVVRGNRSLKIDLYSLLLSHGPTPDMTVAQGDRIVIPAIGPTAAVMGDVRRPAIYELPPGATSIATDSLVELADGAAIRGIYRETLLQIRPDGKQELIDIPQGSQASVRDAEILTVRKAVDYSFGRVTLTGDVRLPGDFSVATSKTVHDLIPSIESLGPEPYLLLGLVDRIDPKTLQHGTIAFSPMHVIAGTENVDLISGDTVRILTRAGAQGLAAQMDAANQPPSTPAVQTTAAMPAAAAPTGAGSATISSGDFGGIAVQDAGIISGLLAGLRVNLSGAVRQPGAYLVAPNTTLADVIVAAGGLDGDADLSGFEVTSIRIDNQSGRSTTSRQIYPATLQQFSQLMVRGLEDVVFHHVYSDQEQGEVTLSGEVRYPGKYRIVRGERLSSIIARAGGYSAAAYPYGAVFTRLSVAKAESEAYIAEAKERESDLAAYLLSGRALLRAPNASTAIAPSIGTVVNANAPENSLGSDSDTSSYLRDITARLRTTRALGRIAINSDLKVLKQRPDLDIVLEPGDELTVPRKPASVNVVGEVRNPSGILFNRDLSAEDYIRAAGGPTRLADTGSAFIIYPDGNSSTLSGGFWSVGSQALAAGCTIVVPRDVIPPVDWIDLTTRVGTIVSQVAITAASLAILGR